MKKLSAAAIGVPLAVVLVWAFETYMKTPVPSEVAAAFGGVLTFLASVLIPDGVEE